MVVLSGKLENFQLAAKNTVIRHQLDDFGHKVSPVVHLPENGARVI